MKMQLSLQLKNQLGGAAEHTPQQTKAAMENK